MHETRTGRRRVLLIAVAASAVVMALAGAPLIGFGADNLDAPNSTSPGTRSDADINDVYVFEAGAEGQTVIAVTTHPAAGAIAPLAYATDVGYKMKIDRNGDAEPDVTYRWRFQAPRPGGRQEYRVFRDTGNGSTLVVHGLTNAMNPVAGGGKAFAGLRSDPFFFDLDAFKGAVLGVMNGRSFCDRNKVDFFESFNTNALVLQVPDGSLGMHIGVWASTNDADGKLDRMGRPAINTVFNSGDDKNLFNAGRPATDRARFGDNVVGVLLAFSALDSEGAYTNGQANAIADILLPDMVTYDTSTDAVGPLNGRAPADDVIDAELNIVTGGLALGTRNGNGAIPSDCIGPHGDYQAHFPYLGEPHH